MKILKLNLMILSLLVTVMSWGQNVSLPQGSANPNDAGVNNVALGGSSFNNLTGGIWNVGIGQNTGANTAGSGFPNLTGSFNTFIGGNAGRDNVSGVRNMYLGLNAGRGNNGDDNIFIGTRCGESISNLNNTLLIGTALDLSTPLIYGNLATNQLGVGTSVVNDNILSVGGSMSISDEDPNKNTYLDIYGNGTAGWNTQIRFYGSGGLRHLIADDLTNNRLLIRPGYNGGATSMVHLDGDVLIGNSATETPPGYNLYVREGILAEKVKVANSAGIDWADYVFEADYHRNTITEVETFVIENKHLPNVPSAKEVSANGIDMVEMDATLLRQIEELWLHVIDLKKENEALKAEVKGLK